MATRNRGNTSGSGHPCATCSHPDRRDIDQQLAALIPLRKLSKRFGISIAALSNHRSKHTSRTEFATIKRARAGANSKSPKSALARIEDGLEALEEVMTNSAKNQESSQWLAGYKERLRTLEIIGKARGEFTDAPNVTVNLWQTPDWQRLRVVIFEVLGQYPEIRATLAKKLLVLEGGADPAPDGL